MNPLEIGLDVVGFGMQAFGAFGAASAAHQEADISKGIAADEQQISDQKRQQMELEARRSTLQQFRNIQRLRAQATAAAVNQGANFGSGLKGGLAETTNEGLFNAQGIQQNLKFGENIFNINSDISSKKMQLADVQASMATDQAWMSLGGALMKNSGTIGNLGKNAASMFSFPSSGVGI